MPTEQLNKSTMERMCRDAGMVPEKRVTIDGREVFIADGFSKVPHFTYGKFGVEKDEFPDGAFCTIWFASIKEDKVDVGCPMFFEKNHNPELMGSARQHARINAAIKHARHTLQACDEVRGMQLHA